MLRILSRARARTDALLQMVHLPERFRGTVVENWVRYWKGLIGDYKDVVVDTVTTSRQRPGKAATYIGLGILAATAMKKNPPENAYRARVIETRDEVALVAPSVRNPASQLYLNTLEKLFNEERIRHISLGVLSLYWVADTSASLGLPKAQCSFLQPALASWHKRVIEVGFWGKFWSLEDQLRDFDVNPAEWESVSDKRQL